MIAKNNLKKDETDFLGKLFSEEPAPDLNSPRGEAFPPLPVELRSFAEFGRKTLIFKTEVPMQPAPVSIDTFVNEYWTSRQRDCHSLHEVSYRACFKPQLPAFFIQRLTQPGEIVYDPFMGRGTTLLEAALRARIPFGNDANPLSRFLIEPRLHPPELAEVARRLKEIPWETASESPEDLLVFYHPQTLKQIGALKKYLLDRRLQETSDAVDRWITLVALNRLTGHSPGFFSVYTMPPNQAVSVKSQRKINERRQQIPSIRDVSALILKKSRQLLVDCDQKTRSVLEHTGDKALLLTGSAAQTPQIQSNQVSLIVTSPPFLNVVDYAGDNWLRCWFLGIDPSAVKMTTPRKLEHWEEAMRLVFSELTRILKPGGHIAFEVGEVHGGKVRLEEAVIRAGAGKNLEPLLLQINDQEFTKTANCWGVQNNLKGTNTNRLVIFRKV